MSISIKSCILDIADNWTDASFMGVRSIDFYLSGSLITVTPGTNCTAYATTEFSASYDADFAFNTALSKIGSYVSTAWMSSANSVTNQRLVVVFDSAQDVDTIKINNTHHSGAYTNRGIQNTVITSSTDAITDTTYEAAITNATILFDGAIPQHAATDTVDEYEIVLPVAGVTNDIEFTLPTITCSMEGAYAEIDITLPVFNCAIGGAAMLDVAIPTLTMDGYINAISHQGTLTGSLAALTCEITTLEYNTSTMTLPSLTMTAQAVTNFLRLDAEFPEFTFIAETGAELLFELPELTATSTGFNGILASLECQLPELSFLGYTASQMQIELSTLAMSSVGVNTYPTDLEITLPILDAVFGATFTALTTLSCDIKRLTFSGTAYHNVVSAMQCYLPALTVQLSSIAEITADLEVNIPFFRNVRIEVLDATTVTLEVSLPIIEFEAYEWAEIDTILRHIRGQRR